MFPGFYLKSRLFRKAAASKLIGLIQSTSTNPSDWGWAHGETNRDIFLMDKTLGGRVDRARMVRYVQSVADDLEFYRKTLTSYHVLLEKLVDQYQHERLNGDKEALAWLHSEMVRAGLVENQPWPIRFRRVVDKLLRR